MKQMLLFEFVDTGTDKNTAPVICKKVRQGEQTPQITEDPIIEPEEKTQASSVTLETTSITSPSSPETIPDANQFPGIAEEDPNKPLWDEIESGNFDRNSIIDRYKTLGETAVIENDRGLIDSHRRRAAHLGQFFTPALIVEFITRLLKLDSTNLNPIIIDNSCGAGGMFRYLSPTCRIAGIELEENAYRMAKALYPDANIINDDLINHAELDNKVDFCLINPPFSIQIEKKNMKLENAGWGKLGPSSSILSHIAAMEIAIRSSRGYVAAVVPTSFFENESTLTFERWINEHGTKVMRIDLPAEAFKKYGTEWHCSVVIYRLARFYSRNRTDSELIHLKINSLSELDDAITTWRLSGHETDLNQFFENILKEYPLEDLILQKHEEETESKPNFRPLPITEKDCSRIVLSGDASQIRIKPNGLLAALKNQEIMDDFGEAYNNATKTNVQEFKMYTRRSNIIENPGRIYELKKKAEGLGIETVIDPQILNWLRNKKKWLRRQLVPFEQWIYQESMEQAVKNPSLGDVLIAINNVADRLITITAGKEYIVKKSMYRDAFEITDDSGNTRDLENFDMSNFILKDYEPGKLVELNAENGIRTAYASLYKQRIKQLEKLGIDWLYPFQGDDVARMALKDSNLLCNDMGLGKCLLPNTMVYVNGKLMAIEDVWGKYHTEIHFDDEGYWSIPSKRLYTNSIDLNGKIVRSQIEMLYKQDIDEKIKTVVLADGSEISSTLSHKFLSPDGWSNEIGKYVCVPARLLQHGYKSMNKDMVSFIAWQIAEGYERDRENPNNRYKHAVDITQKDISVLLSLKEKFKAFGLDFTPKIITPKDGRASHLMVIRKGYRDYVERLGYVWGMPSNKKTIPGFIQELNNDCIAVFLQSYFDAESCPVLSMRSIEISTASEKLINQLSMLLRRFGIWLRVSMKMKCATNGTRIKRPYWIGIIGGNGLRLYKEHIGYSIKKKQEMLERICEKKTNTNIEGIPASGIVRDLHENTGLSIKSLGVASDVYVNGTQEFSRESIQKVIDSLDRILSGEAIERVMQDPVVWRRGKRKEVLENIDMNYVESVRNRLAELTRREVFYARVKSMELKDYSGPVYDLTVKEHHNFIANGCLCHNTREIIALGILYGCKQNLIVVEARLKDSFIDEFKALKITDYKVLEDEKDLRNLKKFNIISYNKLWRPLNNKTKKTFGKALRRRFGYIAIDEGHGIKAQGSKQALAVRCLKSRYKLISTGTPIANYPRNIFSLLTFGWGDGTELNKYGYYTPVTRPHGGYTSGTRLFKEKFVTIDWVTPQFEQTLDKGRKSREMPKIKDIKKWHAMLGPKMIRRTRDEPDVTKSIKIPDAKIEEMIVKPDAAQIAHYKKWLDEFANWFKQQLELEKEGGHRIDQMIILAHLTKLQFASTIPQSPSTNFTGFEWTGNLTTKQAKTMDLIKEAIANKEKIIVYSERPEFQKFIQTELKKINIASHVFIGEQGIEDRNDLLDDFKNNGTNVLLATTTCGGTGLNIPEANVVVIADTSWTPARQIQAYSRILRPQQKKQPRIFLLRCNGTIDMYMRQLMNAKSNAINQGIDHSEYEEIDMKKWLSYRDFTIKMLKDEGYDVGIN